MLVPQLAYGLGQTTPTTLDPQTAALADVLADAEAKLKLAFSKLAQLSAIAPNQTIAPELIQSYTEARNGFVAAAEVWKKAYEDTPAADRFDANAVPVFPPEIGVATPTAGWGGWGTVLTTPTQPIRLSQITVKYGPVGHEKVGTLEGALHDGDVNDWMWSAPSGLGLAPVVAFLIGLALTAATVVLVTVAVTKERGKVEVARADAERQQALAAINLKAFEALTTLVAKCVGTSTDPAVHQRCTAEANAAAVAVLKGVAGTAVDPSKPGAGLGFFGIIGIVATVAAVSVGGYMLYRYKQSRPSLPKATARSKSSF